MAKSSINDRLIDEDMHHIQYSFALFRILHFIIALRLKHSITPILLQKFDIDSIFKRIALHLTLAFRTIITISHLAYISLCLTFSGKLSCSDFSLLAELMADVINKVMTTNRLSCLLKTSRYIDLHDKPCILDESIPFTNPPKLLFKIPTPNDKYTDLYVDNFISVCLDREVDSLHKATWAFNITINVFDKIFNQAADDNPNNIFRNCALSLRKLHREGTPSEIKKVLGWIINKWVLIITTILQSDDYSEKKLERLMGKLIRASMIMPGSIAFIKPL